MDDAERRENNGASPRAILLIPGFCSPARVLGPLERRLQRRLRCATRVISLGSACGDIRDLAECAHVALEQTQAALSRGSIDVVGHSMGGLVAAYLLKCLDQGRRVRRVVTLGTPHRGLAMARAGSVLPGPLGTSLRQLRPGSALLGLLARLELPAPCELVSVAGLDDAIVPPSAARLPEGARQRNVALPAVDHLGLVFSRRAADSLVALLDAPAAECASRGGSAWPGRRNGAGPQHRNGRLRALSCTSRLGASSTRPSRWLRVEPERTTSTS